MPLVEPLEYKETERVRDFVIVIDTSESVRGDPVSYTHLLVAVVQAG